MNKNIETGSGLKPWYPFLPWLFLLVGLVGSFFFWQSERALERNAAERVFQTTVDAASNDLERQFVFYEQSLYGMKSLFDSSEFVTNNEFQLFVHDMLKVEFLPSLRQVGFIKYIDAKRPNTYRVLAPKFQQLISADTGDTQFAPVIYTATSQKNTNTQKVVNAFDGPMLKRALEKSAQHYEASLTETVDFLYEGLGSVILLPVYDRPIKKGERSHTPISQSVYGWVFASLDTQAIFNTSLAGEAEANTEIRYALHQYSEASGAGALVYENVASPLEKSFFSTTRKVAYKNNQWQLVAQSLAPFEEHTGATLFSHANRAGFAALLMVLALTSSLFLLVSRLKAFDEVHEANRQLRISDERWRFALEGSESGVWDWNIAEDHIDYSKRWMQMFGFTSGDISGTLEEWQDSLHPEDRDYVCDALDAYLQGSTENYSLEYRLKSKDGSWKWILSRGMIVARNAQDEPSRMVGTHADISQLKESEKMIWQHANFDYLTNLPNRRMLYARLEREIEKCKRLGINLALFFLDLDGFKEINDTLGHDHGDILLEQAAVRLSECTFTNDVVARLGGDEFIILVSEVETKDIKHLDVIAQKILTAMSAPFALNHKQAFISASIGIAVYPDDAETIDELIKSVDQAMYASKARGGNCFTYFTPSMQEEAQNRLRLSNDLRSALDKGELFIEYQPIVELESNAIYKAEALLRWQHSEKGLISPAEFIPIAEDTRLINDIGNWVFIESIKQCDQWRESLDARFQISVNKSAVQFMNADPEHSAWLKLLSTKAGKSNVITVEITESLLLEPTGQVGVKLQEYRSKGVEIALDDFGTGYSSLAYLRKFEIDYLKIDRSFVANLEKSKEDQVVCKAIIVMAHNLGIQVIAEGIETAGQRDILMDSGCDYGQGFYFAKSLKPEQFEAYATQNS